MPPDDDGLTPYDDFVHKAYGLANSENIVAVLVTPSSARQWMLSLRRARGRFALRVTRLDKDVWRAMLQRMAELQGQSVSLAEADQWRALADVSARASFVERPLDQATANLLVVLWKALISRTQVVEPDVMGFDGTAYRMVAGNRSGQTVSPRYGSVLERATSIAGRLARFVEYPQDDNASDLPYVREMLKDTIARAKSGEPCLVVAGP